jgi:hypothetical protein
VPRGARQTCVVARFAQWRCLGRLVRHDDRAACGEHAADAVADRDPGVGDLGGGGAAHLAHALLQRVHAVHAGMHVGEAAAIGVERQLAAGSGVALGDETAGLAARHKAQILEAVDRQMRKAYPWQRTGGVVDHQMVDVLVVDAGLSEGFGAGDAERARGGEILHLADHRRLDTLAGAEQVDRLLREVAGALGGNQDQRTTAIGHQTTLDAGFRPAYASVNHSSLAAIFPTGIASAPVCVAKSDSATLTSGSG